MHKYHRRAPAVWWMAVAIAAACLANHANAQPAPNNVATGKKLSEQYCVQCHVVVPSGKLGWTDAPAFDAIANRQGVTAAKLSDIVQKPHMHMLNDQRPKAEADAVAAYILSLRRR